MKLTHLPVRPLVLLAVIASLAFSACNAPAQTAHIMTVAVITTTTAFDSMITAFKASMTDAGFVEGKSINYVYNGATANDSTAVDQEIQKLIGQNPDLFLTVGSLTTIRIKDVLQKTNKPAIFAPVTNPEKLGLVSDLRKPGGHMTGINTGGAVTTKGFEWLLTAAPDVKRVHVYYLRGDVTSSTQFPSVQAVADSWKVELVLHEIGSAEEALAAVSSLVKGTDAVLALPTTAFVTQADFLKAAVQYGIPVGTTSFSGAPINQLTGLSVNTTAMGKQVAHLVQQVLHGADAGTMPVETSQYTRVLNLVAAKSLGLTISDSVLKQADNVIRTDPTPQPTTSSSNGTPPATSSR